MPIAATCAKCRTEYALPDAMRGMSFTCDQCRASVAVEGPSAANAAVKQGEPSEYPAASPLTARVPPPSYDPSLPVPDIELPPRRQSDWFVVLGVFGVVLVSCTGLFAVVWGVVLVRPAAPPGVTKSWAPPATMAIPLPPPKDITKEAQPDVKEPAPPVEKD